MSKTKLTILISLLLTLGLGGWGCLKKPIANKNINTDVNQNLNTNTQQEATLSEPDENGWRTHINPLAGFMFKFQDPEKKIQFRGGDRDRSVFVENYGSKLRYGSELGIHMYIDKLTPWSKVYGIEPKNFQEYIEKIAWKVTEGSRKLVSLKKITYPNIEEGYLAKIEEDFGYIRDVVFINNTHKDEEYIMSFNMSPEFYTQILQTFQFLPLP